VLCGLLCWEGVAVGFFVTLSLESHGFEKKSTYEGFGMIYETHRFFLPKSSLHT
jgi:hypothetical protein